MNNKDLKGLRYKLPLNVFEWVIKNHDDDDIEYYSKFPTRAIEDFKKWQ